MRRYLRTMVCLVLTLSVLPAVFADAATVKPGDSLTIRVPFSSAEPIEALQASYTISSGLEFVSGSCMGMTGSASASKAVFISMGGVSEGTLTLNLKVREDAAGAQQVTIISLKGGSSGASSAVSLAAAYTYAYSVTTPVEPTAVPTAVLAPVRTSVPTSVPTPGPTAAHVSLPTDWPTVVQTVATPTVPVAVPTATAATIHAQEAPVLTGSTFDAPDGFEVLKAAASNVPKYFTGISLPGLKHTIYAFTDKKGTTQFRAYGRIHKKKGMYEAQVLTELVGETLTLNLSVLGEVPIRDRLADCAEAKPVALDDATLPEGYKTTTKRGVLCFTNLFNQKEYRVLGELLGIDKAYYPAVNGRPRIGSLAIDLEGDKERMPGADGMHYKVPKEYRDGFAVRVFILTGDGHRVSVWTDKPILDITLLK